MNENIENLDNKITNQQINEEIDKRLEEFNTNQIKIEKNVSQLEEHGTIVDNFIANIHGSNIKLMGKID